MTLSNIEDDPPVILKTTTIRHTKTFLFLGVTVLSNLSWKHIQQVVKSISVGSDVIRCFWFHLALNIARMCGDSSTSLLDWMESKTFRLSMHQYAGDVVLDSSLLPMNFASKLVTLVSIDIVPAFLLTNLWNSLRFQLFHYYNFYLK